MKNDTSKTVRGLLIAGVVAIAVSIMWPSLAEKYGTLKQTASNTLKTETSVNETEETDSEMAAKETEKPRRMFEPVLKVEHDENGNAEVTVVQDYQHKDTDKTSSSYSASSEQKSSAVSSSGSHSAGGGGGSTGPFVNDVSGTSAGTYSSSSSASDKSSYESKSNDTSSSGYKGNSNNKKKYDPYDAYDYDDADDFADDWAEEFGYGDYDDGYDEAYDYWEDEMDD